MRVDINESHAVYSEKTWLLQDKKSEIRYFAISIKGDCYLCLKK